MFDCKVSYFALSFLIVFLYIVRPPIHENFADIKTYITKYTGMRFKSALYDVQYIWSIDKTNTDRLISNYYEMILEEMLGYTFI